MSEKNTPKKRGFFAEMVYNNPVFGLYLGICSTLAVSTSLNNAIGMGVCVIIVLVLSNVIISIISKFTPDDIHIPVYIVVIATLVTLVGMLMQAYTPQLYTALGAFVDLIVVNCIILGRAEAYACKHNVVDSIKDGLMMGLAYTFSLLAMSFIRQFFGTGALSLVNPFNNATIFDVQIIPAGFEIPILTSQTGAFLTFAVLAAAVTAYKNNNDAKEKAAEAAAMQRTKAAADKKEAA